MIDRLQVEGLWGTFRALRRSQKTMTTAFDVIVIGAGISGIDAAHHLKTTTTKTFAVLERRSSYGGTWDLFTYPGVRSDSDMFTFGYAHKPWKSEKSIAPGNDILAYLKEAIEDDELHAHIQFDTKVVRASWSSIDSRWHLTTSEGVRYECQFLIGATGYYEQDAGYEPLQSMDGVDEFLSSPGNKMIHPQKWGDETVDWENKNVVVVGSGATAVTLIPNLTDKAKHVTMLQRSPTYIMGRPNKDNVASFLLSLPLLPQSLVHSLLRWRVVLRGAFYQALWSRMEPEALKKMFLGYMRQMLPEQYMSDEEFEKHFVPAYFPWQQRLCLCPDFDFYKVLKNGEATIVTDHIERFDANGIQLKSGKHLQADLIITATGLVLQRNAPMAGMLVDIDGVEYIAKEHTVYEGCMLDGVPNFGFITGYFTASWTLKADIICSYLSRVINYMNVHDMEQCCPIKDENFVQNMGVFDVVKSGYVQRGREHALMQGEKAPWRALDNYAMDRLHLDWKTMEDGALKFVKTRRARM